MKNTEELIFRYMERGNLTREQVLSAGVDCLDFMMRAQDAGMIIGVKDGRKRWEPVEIIVPGLTVEVL